MCACTRARVENIRTQNKHTHKNTHTQAFIARISRQDNVTLGAQPFAGIGKLTPEIGEMVKGASLVKPAVIFDAEHTVDLGGVTVRLAGGAGEVTRSVLAGGIRAAVAADDKPLLDALRVLGVDIYGDGLPFDVHGRGAVTGGTVHIDASASSQFVSGLLLAAPALAQTGSFVNWESPQTHPVDITPNGQVLAVVNTADARLEVFDLQGHRVATLVDDMRPAGTHQEDWSLRGLPSGVYFCHLSAASDVAIRKVVVVR